MNARILLAEDDVKQAYVIQAYLAREGALVSVVHDGQSAVAAYRQWRPDLIIVDVMLPRLNGLDVCRVLRAESGVPIIMLTANNTEQDLLAGLAGGADDYITKPFSPRELVARISTVLRRAERSATSDRNRLSIGSLSIDVTHFEVRIDDRPVALTTREFGILLVLAAEPGRVFSRTEIVARAYGACNEILDRTVDAHVMNLRRKIDRVAGRPGFIQTVYARGYRLVNPS